MIYYLVFTKFIPKSQAKNVIFLFHKNPSLTYKNCLAPEEREGMEAEQT